MITNNSFPLISDVKLHKAVNIIQKCWRRYSRRKIFCFYKSMLNFHMQINPNLLLKTINPKESQLFDVASGLYVRLRFGGSDFPPRIFYKIYTHKPLIDLCEFSPRDYTQQVNKYLRSREVHNKHTFYPSPNKPKTYSRVDLNSWRPINQSIKEFSEILNYENTYSLVSSKQIKHTRLHFSFLKAKQNSWKKKINQICKMQHIYKESADETRFSELDVNEHEVSVIGHSEHDDAQQLLVWTKHLDYDNYLDYWHTLATTKPTDNLMLLNSD